MSLGGSRPRAAPVVTITEPPAAAAPPPRPVAPIPAYKQDRSGAEKFVIGLMQTAGVSEARHSEAWNIGDPLYTGAADEATIRAQVSKMAIDERSAKNAETQRIATEDLAARKAELAAPKLEDKAIQDATAEAIRKRQKTRGQRSTIIASRLFNTESTSALQETLGA